MILYKGRIQDFCEQVRHNRLSTVMAETFSAHHGYAPQFSELQSWLNSTQHIKNIIELAGLNDNMICLEYEVPYNTGRIDCLFFGRGENGRAYTVLIELKQWTGAEEVDDEENFIVETFTGGTRRKVSHPSQQVEGYHRHLLSFVQIFEEGDNDLYSCAFCHNYEKETGRGLFAERYNRIIDQFPVYTREDIQKLADKLKSLLAKGDGFEIFNRFMQSPIRPSKKLLENASKIVAENKAVFSLLNEQLVAKNVIMSKVRKAGRAKQKSVIIVQGGPGTGKTVIALNVLAELAAQGRSVFYGCKSKPFRSALERLVGINTRDLFSNLTRFLPSRVKEDEFDVVLIDEAHRIAKTSNFQYTNQADRTDMPQIEQIIRCAKTAVFFIDDKQNVRGQEIGSSELIKSTAQRYGTEFESVQLVSQFRCAGSDNYLDWLESALGYSAKHVDLKKDDRFDFRIVDNPNTLYQFIKAQENKKLNSARLVAGYCWPWSTELNADGSLIKDVVIPEYGFAMPWEARDSSDYPAGTHLQLGIPKWFQWAYKTKGVEQVGCIYTVQGFEFDYIGVIIGPDLKYDQENDRLIADISAIADPTLRRHADHFENYVKNIYRVLMSRGMKGCYVYFCDKEVEAYFRKRMEDGGQGKDELRFFDIISADEEMIARVEKDIEEHLKYSEYLPLYTAEAACGGFGRGNPVEHEGWIKVEGVGPLNRNMYVVKAFGKSMEPMIPDGAYCVFKMPTAGSRNNKVVLVEHHGISDPDHGGKHTIKRYRSEKSYEVDGTWKHERIVLKAENPDYEDIVIDDAEDGEFFVVGELVGVVQ